MTFTSKPSTASASVASPVDPSAGLQAMLHFMAAYLFLIAGTGALLWNSGRLASGFISDPRVVGGIHFLTLGWLSVSILGATRVFTGIALGSQGSRLRLAPWIGATWIAGTALFPCGLILSHSACIVTGAALIGIAIALYTVQILPALTHASRGDLTRAYMSVALISLWETWLLGLSASLARAGVSDVIGFAPPPGYFSAHILLAVFGWIGATVAGVGSHLLPMFALSKNPPLWPVKAALPLWTSLPVMAGLSAFRPEPFFQLGWSIAGVASVLWLVQVIFFFRTRLRQERDSGLFLAFSATLILGAAWVLLLMSKTSLPFIALVLVGWLVLFTLGVYHRVVPFLVWYQRFARVRGGPMIRVKELLNERLALATAATALMGVILWGTGLVLGAVTLVTSGAALLLLGALLPLGQLYFLYRKPPGA